MMSIADKKTYRLTIALGPGLRAVRSRVTVYAIRKGRTTIVCDDKKVEGNRLNLRLKPCDGRFFQAVATVERYRFEGRNGDVGRRRIQLTAIFCRHDRRVSIGERETVANAYAFARLLRLDKAGNAVISADKARVRAAYRMRDNFILANGRQSSVIAASPNGLETNSQAMFNFLASLLYYCIVDAGVYARFLELVGVSSKHAGTAAALWRLVRRPFHNAEAIYRLIEDRQPRYLPALTTITPPEGQSRIPNQWTLSIKANDSGSRNFLIGGPAYIVFDKHGRGWLNNNVTQGTPNSSAFCSVLNPDGSPWKRSPVSGGGLLGAAFGIAADNKGERIYVGNFGWGPTQCNPLNGSISVIKANGEVESPPEGCTNALARVQGMAFDSHGNLWMASWGSQAPLAPVPGTIYDLPSSNSAVVVYLDADPGRAITFSFDAPDYGPFGLTLDSRDNCFVAITGNGDDIPSSVYKLRIKRRGGEPQIVQQACWKSDYRSPIAGNKRAIGSEGFRQVTVNRRDEVFVGAIKSNRVIKLDNDLNVLTSFKTNINGPWGIVFDAEGTMFVANFYPTNTPWGEDADSPDPTGAFGVTVIRDEDDAGAQLMTLPSAGDEVMLANGFPLYGNLYGPSYDPLQRMTSTNIDRLGNLWAVNNWKPSLVNNLKANPGGDGVVIFLGVAEPRRD